MIRLIHNTTVNDNNNNNNDNSNTNRCTPGLFSQERMHRAEDARIASACELAANYT